jgi:hypothetical protein
MIGTKSLSIVLLTVLSSAATSAEIPRATVSRLTSTSFSLEIPNGWEKQKLTGSHQGSTPLYDLVPTGSGSPSENSASKFYIRVVYYPNRVPIAAKLRWDSKNPPMPELSRLDGLPDWSAFGFAPNIVKTAFMPIGGDVLVVDLNAPDQARYAQGQKVLLDLLKSYREIKEGARTP